MKLVQSQCKKQGYETYTDLYLVIEDGGKEVKIAIRPSFWRDMGKLKEVATKL